MNDEEERAEVWHVLSDLWTDTDLQPADRAAMAHRLAATRYSLGELERIFRDEIAPATARVVAAIPLSGGMAVPDAYRKDEIVQRVRALRARAWARRRLNPLRRWIDCMSVRFARPEWERVKAEITALRGS